MIFNLYEIKVMIIVVKKKLEKDFECVHFILIKSEDREKDERGRKSEKWRECQHINKILIYHFKFRYITPSTKPMRPILVNSLSVSGVSKFFVFVFFFCGNETENFSKIETYCVPLEFTLALLYLKAGYCMHARSTTRRYFIYLLTAVISK